MVLAPENRWNKVVWRVLERQFNLAGATLVYLSVGASVAKSTLPRGKPTTVNAHKLLASLSLSPSVLTLPMIRQLRIELIKAEPELEAWVGGHKNIQWYQSTNSGFWLHGLTAYQKKVDDLLTAMEQYLAHQIIAEHLKGHEGCWQQCFQAAETADKPASVTQLSTGLHICQQGTKTGAQICALADTISLMVQPQSQPSRLYN